MKYSKIIGTGSSLPERVVTNFDLEKMVDTTNDWIIERTGIHRRHLVSEHETVVTLAEEAAIKAMAAANIKPQDLDLIIIATTTPEKVFPSTACLLQERFKISGCIAFDLNSAACAGFIYGVGIADQFIRTGAVKNALIIGSEAISRVLDWTDRTTCVLFGDGAGAVVLTVSDEPGIMSTHLHADGMHKDVLFLPTPLGKPNVAQQELHLTMQGNPLFKLAVNILGDLFDETLAANQMEKSQVDWLIPHQANLRIIQAMARKLDLPMERVAITLDEQGNTSSASIPLALDKIVRNGQVKKGDILLLEGFGGGLAWGSALVKY